MRNRLAALQRKLDGAIKAYREHIETELAADATAEQVTAHDAKTAQLKAAMDAASTAVQAERAALDAERELLPSREAIDREPEISGGASARERDPRRGFATAGDYFRAVHTAGLPGGRVDERLTPEQRPQAATPSTYGNEATGVDGGYLVPPEYARQIYMHSLEEGSFLPLTDGLPITGNSITFPTDETSPWGTDGIRVYWASEASAANQNKPKLGERTLKLRKMIGLVPMTDELIADAMAGGAYVNKKLGQSMAWKINAAIVGGNGGQIPLGYRNSGAIITQAAEGGQTATTLNANNVAKMLARLTPAALGSQKVRWLINNDVLPQLLVMTLGQQPIWTPPQAGFKDAPFGFLLGRPIIVSQVCSTLGTVGDIQLVDFGQYQTISKGPEYAESMHLFFDADAMAYRVTFRMDGQPWLTAAVSPANGANTLSPFVQLAAR